MEKKVFKDDWAATPTLYIVTDETETAVTFRRSALVAGHGWQGSDGETTMPRDRWDRLMLTCSPVE
jgi:hypothetical protein